MGSNLHIHWHGQLSSPLLAWSPFVFSAIPREPHGSPSVPWITTDKDEPESTAPPADISALTSSRTGFSPQEKLYTEDTPALQAGTPIVMRPNNQFHSQKGKLITHSNPSLLPTSKDYTVASLSQKKSLSIHLYPKWKWQNHLEFAYNKPVGSMPSRGKAVSSAATWTDTSLIILGREVIRAQKPGCSQAVSSLDQWSPSGGPWTTSPKGWRLLPPPPSLPPPI